MIDNYAESLDVVFEEPRFVRLEDYNSQNTCKKSMNYKKDLSKTQKCNEYIKDPNNSLIVLSVFVDRLAFELAFLQFIERMFRKIRKSFDTRINCKMSFEISDTRALVYALIRYFDGYEDLVLTSDDDEKIYYVEVPFEKTSKEFQIEFKESLIGIRNEFKIDTLHDISEVYRFFMMSIMSQKYSDSILKKAFKLGFAIGDWEKTIVR